MGLECQLLVQKSINIAVKLIIMKKENYVGWTSDGIEEIYCTKKEAEDAVVHAFGGDCGDCGFKSKAEIFKYYPVFKATWVRPIHKDKDNFKGYNEIANVG